MGRGKTYVLAALALLVALLALPAAAPAASHSMIVQPDGKIVLASGVEYILTPRGTMARFNPDGSLDAEFGAGGGLVDYRDRRSFGPLALQPGGQIVAATESGADAFVLEAFTPDGSPDLSFGRGGVAIGPALGQGWGVTPSALLPQPDGNLIAGGTIGTTQIKAAFLSNAQAQLYGAAGDFRTVIGTAGYPSGPEALKEPLMSDLIPMADGSLVAIGATDREGSYSTRIFAARFVPGSPTAYDASFAGGAGVALLDPYPHPARIGPPSANAGIASGDRLILAGAAQRRILLVGLDRDGVPDNTFGEGGFATLPLAGSILAEATAVAVQPDGKIVFAGVTHDWCDAAQASGCWRLVVGRANADGSVDSTFGSGGFARLDAPNGSATEPKEVDVALTADGKILVSETTQGRRGQLLSVARFDSQGSLDPTFAGDGVATVAPCEGSVAALRASGCISSARVTLRAAGLRSRRPRLKLGVEATEQLDPLRNVRLFLPRGLESRTRKVALRARLLTAGGEPEPAVIRAKRRRVAAWRLGTPASLSLNLPAGTLRRTKRIAPGRKLAFRVQVWFQDGSSQTVVLRRPR